MLDLFNMNSNKIHTFHRSTGLLSLNFSVPFSSVVFPCSVFVEETEWFVPHVIFCCFMSLCYCLTCFYAPDSILKMKVWVSCSVVSDCLWPHGPWPAWLLYPWNFPGKDTSVGSHSLLQGIFLTQRLNPGLLHCRQILYHLSHQGRHITCTPMVTSGDFIRSRSVFFCFP